MRSFTDASVRDMQGNPHDFTGKGVADRSGCVGRMFDCGLFAGSCIDAAH
jgi:hypothetical protein